MCGILMRKVQQRQWQQHQEQHAHFFFVKLGTQSDTLFRFIILYNRPYAVLFIATHANQQTAPPGSTTKINWKTIKTLVYLLLRLFSHLLHVFCKVFQHFCCSHCTKLPKWPNGKIVFYFLLMLFGLVSFNHRRANLELSILPATNRNAIEMFEMCLCEKSVITLRVEFAKVTA